MIIESESISSEIAVRPDMPATWNYEKFFDPLEVRFTWEIIVEKQLLIHLVSIESWVN